MYTVLVLSKVYKMARNLFSSKPLNVEKCDDLVAERLSLGNVDNGLEINFEVDTRSAIYLRFYIRASAIRTENRFWLWPGSLAPKYIQKKDYKCLDSPGMHFDDILTVKDTAILQKSLYRDNTLQMQIPVQVLLAQSD